MVSRAYHSITSLAYYDKVFFWTDGRQAWREEFDPGFSQYRHNNLLLFDPPYTGFHLFHPKAQPTNQATNQSINQYRRQNAEQPSNQLIN